MIGCGSSGSGDQKKESGYVVKFYDANLDLNHSLNLAAAGSIDLSELRGEYDLPIALYAASSSDSIEGASSYPITHSVNFYGVPNVIEIRTELELNDIRFNIGEIYSYLDTNMSRITGAYILMNDIALTSATLDDTEGWSPIGTYDDIFNIYTFTGILNGNGYKVSGLWNNGSSTENIGLFGYISGAQIKNLGVAIDNAKGGITGNNQVAGGSVGAIAGYIDNGSSINNSYSTGNISMCEGDDGSVGAIAGKVENSSINNSYSTGNISGGRDVGGIAGSVYKSLISASYSTGNVSGEAYSVGGIAGWVYSGSAINGSHSTGTISGAVSTGGIAGIADETSITNSYATGDVSSRSDAFVGGIAGYLRYDSSISASYSTGNISGGRYVGGIAGYVVSASINNSYSTGNISEDCYDQEDFNGGCYYVGGIAGEVENSSISASYSTGNISGSAHDDEGDSAGGIAGSVNAGQSIGNASSIENNAAINSKIVSGDSPSVSRVVGRIDSTFGTVTVSNNFALDTMIIKGVVYEGSTSDLNGTSKSNEDLKTSTIYSDAVSGDGLGGLGWKFGDDDANPWQMREGNDYPVLYWQQ
ncbi:MAG: hypothetical protein LBI57_06265 [Helicobacteraceae bacterium]|nr:hypothetical protein [Helicobacteraceae bacterium]